MTALTRCAIVLTLLVAGACSSGGNGAEVGSGQVAGTTAPETAPPTTATTTTLAADPVAADTPAGLADQIETAERAIRDPATPRSHLVHHGRAQQVAYGALGNHPEWHDEVLAAVAEDVRPAVEANLAALVELRRLYEADSAYYGPQPDLPDWTIVAPEPVAALVAEYQAAEEATGVPWEYLAAIHFVETRTGRIRGNSVAGAQGPMQFIPSTWEIYGRGGDINDTHDAVHAAARLLRANGAPADMASALYSYNPSDRYVRAITAYAQVMEADPRAFLGYHQWQVYYAGTLLPEGYDGG